MADKTRFAELKAIQEGGVEDPLLARQIKVLYLQYLGKQVDPELLAKMVAKANAVEQAFNVYRPKVDGQELSDNDVRQVLRRSTDSARRRAIWEASKGVGPVVAADLRAVVELRNEAATKLGFKNYHVMQLFLDEQSQEQVLKLFDELDELTREPFRKAKAEIDVRLVGAADIPVESCSPGTITIRSSRNRRRSSTPTSTPCTPRSTSSSSAASFTPGSACRSTT